MKWILMQSLPSCLQTQALNIIIFAGRDSSEIRLESPVFFLSSRKKKVILEHQIREIFC